MSVTFIGFMTVPFVSIVAGVGRLTNGRKSPRHIARKMRRSRSAQLGVEGCPVGEIIPANRSARKPKALDLFRLFLVLDSQNSVDPVRPLESRIYSCASRDDGS